MLKKISFENAAWREEALFVCHTFRYKQTPDALQLTDCIGNQASDHPEGFDNLSILTKEKFAPGVKATIRCAFEGLGCPEIIIVPEAEKTAEGHMQYGACFEIVLYKNGVNVWRHFMEKDYRCHWHKRLGVEFPVAENDIHALTVETKENYITFSVDGIKTILRTEDLPESFHIGMTLCEGIVRIYDFTVEKA